MFRSAKLVIGIAVLLFQIYILGLESDFLAREVVSDYYQKHGRTENLECFAEGVTALKYKQFNLRFMVLGSTLIFLILLLVPDKTEKKTSIPNL